MVTQILTHIADAISRLIQQYKEKDRIEGIIEALTEQVQELEDRTFELFTLRALDVATGEQLDRFGEIVVQDREGFDDDFYRILLKVKIGINNSSGDPSTAINTIRLLTEATLVHYQNLGDASVGFSVNTEIDSALVDFIFENMQNVVMAGVRIDFISCFDPDESFSFDGTGPIGLGFSSTAAPLTGGMFAFLHRRSTPKFAFDTEAGTADPTASGFGTIADPLAGGIMVGL